MQFEGRGAKRVESENLVFYRLSDDKGEMIREGMAKTLDISRSGMAIESKEPMEAEQRIEVHIGVGEDVVKTKGTVRNVDQTEEKKFQVGLEFDYLTEEDLNKIGMVHPEIFS